MKLLSYIKSKALAVVAPAFLFASSANAEVDLSSLTDKIDVSSVVAAILAIGALGVTVYLTLSGVKIIWRKVRSL